MEREGDKSIKITNNDRQKIFFSTLVSSKMKVLKRLLYNLNIANSFRIRLENILY